MPWPPAEFARYMAKATAALQEHPHRKALSYRFASLLEHGTAEPVPGCPSKACRREFPGLGVWCSQHTVEQLRAHVETADDEVFAARLRRARWLHEFAVRLVGWRRRRGDVVRLRSRRWTWLGVRSR